MTELGARLKEARTAKGYSLEDLQAMTKIQKRYLAGIEDGNYSMMPGPFYVRAFIKQYADAVGLNAEELLESYKTEVPTSTNEEVLQNMKAAPNRRKPISKSSSRVSEFVPMIVVALFFILALVIFWYFYQNIAQKDDTNSDKEDSVPVSVDVNPEENTPIDEEDEEVEEEPVVEPEPVQTIEQGTNDGETTNYTLSGTDTFSVKIVASGRAWVGIKNLSGTVLLDDELAAGETVNLDLSNEQSARIRVGSAPQIDVFVNDEKVEYGIPPEDKVLQNMMIEFVKQP